MTGNELTITSWSMQMSKLTSLRWRPDFPTTCNCVCWKSRTFFDLFCWDQNGFISNMHRPVHHGFWSGRRKLHKASWTVQIWFVNILRTFLCPWFRLEGEPSFSLWSLIRAREQASLVQKRLEEAPVVSQLWGLPLVFWEHSGMWKCSGYIKILTSISVLHISVSPQLREAFKRIDRAVWYQSVFFCSSQIGCLPRAKWWTVIKTHVIPQKVCWMTSRVLPVKEIVGRNEVYRWGPGGVRSHWFITKTHNSLHIEFYKTEIFPK